MMYVPSEEEITAARRELRRIEFARVAAQVGGGSPHEYYEMVARNPYYDGMTREGRLVYRHPDPDAGNW